MRAMIQMPDEAKAKGLLKVLAGAVDRHVKQRPRDAFIRNAIDDPVKPLVRRVTESDACDFCNAFANSKPIDPRKSSEKFHQFCKCHYMLFFQETRFRERFVNAAELERIGVTLESGADPDFFEIRNAIGIAALGKRVEILKRHKSGPRRPDTLVDGKPVEFKNPTSNGRRTVLNQLRSVLYGTNKQVIKPQSDVALISNVQSTMNMVDMQLGLEYALTDANGLTEAEKSALTKVILFDEKTRRFLEYELKK